MTDIVVGVLAAVLIGGLAVRQSGARGVEAAILFAVITVGGGALGVAVLAASAPL